MSPPAEMCIVGEPQPVALPLRIGDRTFLIPCELRANGLYAALTNEARAALAEIDRSQLARYPLAGLELPDIGRQIEHLHFTARNGDTYAYTSPVLTCRGRTRQTVDRGRRDGKRAQRRMHREWRR
jgi:hypothetical protein